MTMRGRTFETEITALGSQGDGVAKGEGNVFHVPYTVPGDRVRLTLGKGDKVNRVERLFDGDARVPPACRHFGT